MKKATRIVGALVVLLIVTRVAGLGYLGRAIKATYLAGHTTANIYDAKHYDLRTMEPMNPIPLQQATGAKAVVPEELRTFLEETESASLLILKNGEVVLEEYYNEHGAEVVGNSFSMAKSVITLLTQIAIQDGYIGSWDDPVTQWVPELPVPEGMSAPTLRHLSTMTSGLLTEENYKKPWAKLAKYYYGNDVVDATVTTPSGKYEPGTEWEYLSASTQLLTLALSRAVGESISSYANRELFSKVGFESTAYWHLDREGGLELGFCCINATTHDFAKLGLFMQNYGKVNGQVVVDSTFIHESTHPFLVPQYGYSFWLYDFADRPIYAFRGLLGQLILVDQERDLVVVRTGQNPGKKMGHFWELDHVMYNALQNW